MSDAHTSSREIQEENLNVTPYCTRFEGASIHARGFAFAAAYASLWTPTQGSDWAAHEYIPRCWVHPAFPRHVLWKPEGTWVFVTQLATGAPRPQLARQLGALALGPHAVPTHETSYPLALRLPMRATATPNLRLPDTACRCRRLWPLSGKDAHIVAVEGVRVEMRVSGSGSPRSGFRLYAEAFVGRAHENASREPRSLIFSAHARHVLLQPNHALVRRFTARLMDQLLAFAYDRQDAGLEVDRKRTTGRMVGRVIMRADLDDVEYAIRLPQPGGDARYVGSYVLP